MATEILKTSDTASGVVYAVVWNASNQVLDFDDETFKALGSAVEPYILADEVTGRGGGGVSGFDVLLDLELLNTTLAVQVFLVEFYRKLGGSPAITTDLCLDDGELRVAAGSLVAAGSSGDIAAGYVVKVGMNVTSTLGEYVQCYAWIEKDGQPVTLGEFDTCVFDCLEFDTIISQFNDGTDPVYPADSNHFETTVEDPSFQDNTCYTLKATIVMGGITLYGQRDMPVVG